MLARTLPASMFYAVADCVTRVDAWNYTYLGEINSTETSSSHGPAAPAAVETGVVFQQNLQSEVTQLGLCVGNFFVMRVSFALALFFSIMALATWCAPLFHNGQWYSKGFLYAVALVGVFFVPNTFFYGYSHFARVLSFLFILLQMVILVDFSLHVRGLSAKDGVLRWGRGPALSGDKDETSQQVLCAAFLQSLLSACNAAMSSSRLRS